MPDTKEQSGNIVHLTIDGVPAAVPKGTNLIEAAKTVGIEIPFYCYHRHLSVAGNCRMCQVEVEGVPKLLIACNTAAAEGMVVRTNRTSAAVADAQRATLEFLLINHPLDCTICDEAGHCRLQDFYYQYNARGSRFIEDKVRKVKALPIGPEIIYDGERCILCTRCVRFCDEVTGTSELAVFERGDKSVIGVHPGRELNNPLSGTVADLCPVGALTHRRWRFNTRFWYTKEYASICHGCSTGCNARIAVRDDKIVLVRGRLNSDVNREWMCDEGRYGFDRFQPPTRMLEPLVRTGLELNAAAPEDAWKAAAKMFAAAGGAGDAAVFLSPFLTLEEMWLALEFSQRFLGASLTSGSAAVQVRRRSLTPVQQVLVSPDYAPNFRAVELLGLELDGGDPRAACETRYEALLDKVRSGGAGRILVIGDQAVLDEDLDDRLIEAVMSAEQSLAIAARGLLSGEESSSNEKPGVHQLCRVILPGRTVNEKNGVMVNKDLRLQRLSALLTAPFGSFPDWFHLAKIALWSGSPLLPEEVIDDRLLFGRMVAQYGPLRGLTLRQLGEFGLSWKDFQTVTAGGTYND